MSTATTSPPRLSERHRRNLRQFVKFGIVGGSGVVVNMIIAILMHKANGGTINAAERLFAMPGTDFWFRYRNLVWIVAFLVANTWNYQLNRSWTFRSDQHRSWWRSFWPFFTIGAVAAFLGMFIQVLLTHPGSVFFLPDPWFTEAVGIRSREYWAQLLTIILTVPINFLVNKLWTFGHLRGQHPA